MEQIYGSVSNVNRKRTPHFSWESFKMLSIFRRLMKNEHGATAIEYTLIASLIAVAAITAFTSVGHKVNAVMSNVANTMT
jgi:pilus assembly protein Flp/PilA